MKLPPSRTDLLKKDLKRGMRHPTETIDVLSSKEMQEFLYRYGELAAKSPSLPPIMTNFASELLELAKSSYTRLTKLWK